MIKKFLLALLVAAPCFADQVAVSNFKYLNTNTNSTIINPAEAQDLLNIDITPGGKSIKKRSGYGLYKQVFTTSSGIHGGYHFFDTTGNDVQLWGSSVSLKGIVADGTPNTIVSSATVNATWDCVDTQGSAYCVDSSRDAFIKTNGTTLTNWYTTPLGTMVESTPDRMAVSGVSTSPNTLFISQSNVFTNFTVGPLTTDAFTEVIAAPGSHITHIRWGCQKLLWWKDQSFGYFDFDDQYSASIKIVSDNIGTYDNTSAIDPGGTVWFRGQDGHIYSYDCSGLLKQTIEITPQIQASGRRSTNSWNQSSQSDFQAGASSPTANMSFSLSPGDVRLSTNTNAINNPGFETGSTFSQNNVAQWTVSGSCPAGNVIWEIATGGGAVSICGGNANPIEGSNFVLGGAFNGVSRSTLTIELINVSSAVVAVSTLPFTNVCTWSTTTLTAAQYANSTMMVRLNSNNDGSSCYAVSNQFTFPGALKFNYMAQWNSNKGLAYIDAFTTLATTGTFLSAVKNAPNLSAWGAFNPSYQADNGTESFFFRSSTNSFTVSSSTPSWTAQTPDSVVSVSTGTYFQLRDDFSVTATTQSPALNEFTVNWFDGAASDQAYMLYFDNAIWASMTYGVGVSSNNYIFRRDLINDGWALYGFGDDGMLIQNNRLYFGSATDGNVYQFGSGTSDNGNAINAYWKSKDFTGGDPFMQNQLNQIDIFAKQNTGQSITSTYTMDTSTATSYTVSLNVPTQTYIQNRKLLPSGKNGYTFNWKISDNSATSAWEIFGFRLTYNTLPWKPTQ